eukprot:TRINITY_DN6218_c0_g2_i1.p1 TRINITY_DN6218_c0_g2~~TRINITY_DN6218_c0_g2_i1.p1  ORF type:complete len:132 (-),score=5.70 TRINITY_DN6218_c0_g2_i1:132-527(-)
MEKLLERSRDYRSLDHTILEFWTDSQGEIPEHKDAVNAEACYVLSMVVWRNCDAVSLEKKYEDARIVIELMTETKTRIDSAGGVYILSLTHGLWSVLAILLGIMLFGCVMCRLPGVREVFILPGKSKKHTD